MKKSIKELPLEERIRLVEDIWDSIADEQEALRLTPEQEAELDRRLEEYRLDPSEGRPAYQVIEEIRQGH